MSAKLGTDQRSSDFNHEGKNCLIFLLFLGIKGRRVTLNLTHPSCQDQTRVVTPPVPPNPPTLRVTATFPLALRLRPCKEWTAAERRICSAKRDRDVYRLIGQRGATVDPVPNQRAVEIQRRLTERLYKWEEKVRVCFAFAVPLIKKTQISATQKNKRNSSCDQLWC